MQTQTVEMAGATFTLVRQNKNGTYRLRNAQGQAFTTKRGEPVRVIPAESPAPYLASREGQRLPVPVLVDSDGPHIVCGLCDARMALTGSGPEYRVGSHEHVASYPTCFSTVRICPDCERGCKRAKLPVRNPNAAKLDRFYKKWAGGGMRCNIRSRVELTSGEVIEINA